MLTLTIKDLKTKTTKTGTPLWNIVTLMDVGKYGNYFSSFIGAWNSAWKENDIININEDQIRGREYNGKMYYTIYAPKSRPAQTAAPLPPATNPQLLRDIYNLLKLTWQQNNEILKNLNSKPKNNLENKTAVLDEIVPLPPDTTDYAEQETEPDELRY